MPHNTIRMISSNDIQSIHEIDKVTNPSPWSLENLNNSLKNHLGYVYLYQQQLTSFLIFANQIDYVEILLLATSPAFERKYFASQLLYYLVAYTKNKKIDRILLEVRKSNTKAQQFYRNNEFVDFSTRKNYYQHPIEDALVMERKC